jgi:hypothetical protein
LLQRTSRRLSKPTAGLFVTANERGWMTRRPFCRSHSRFLEMSDNQHACFIFDLLCFCGHVTEDVATVFRACANLTPIVLPPHSTPLLQVHDTHVNVAFKTAYSKRRNMLETPHTRLSFLESVAQCIAETKNSLLTDGVEANVLRLMRPHIGRVPDAFVIPPLRI